LRWWSGSRSPDLAGGLNNGTLIFALAKLAEAPAARRGVDIPVSRSRPLAEHESELQGTPQLRAAEASADYAPVSPEPWRKRRKAGA
jgi:hypothetical protein